MSSTRPATSLENTAADFLRDAPAQKGRWRESNTNVEGLTTRYHWTGQGRDGIEVALATSARKLSTTEARALWHARHGRSAAPLLVIVAYPHANQVRAVVCGPAGDSPAVADLDLNQAEPHWVS